MAAKTFVWNIEVEGVPYKIEFVKNQVIVNNREPLKLNKLKRTGNSWVESHYAVPLDEEKEAFLHIRQFANPILSYSEKDCKTGEAYVPLKVPGWAWFFVVLHAIDFFILMGGAIGGALQVFVISIIVSVSSNQKKKTASRVLACAGIWLLSTIVQFLLVLMLLPLYE